MSLETGLKSVFSRIGAWLAASVRDFLYFPGMAMLGYGLYLYRPWVAFSVCGALLMITGYLMGDEK